MCHINFILKNGIIDCVMHIKIIALIIYIYIYIYIYDFFNYYVINYINVYGKFIDFNIVTVKNHP